MRLFVIAVLTPIHRGMVITFYGSIYNVYTHTYTHIYIYIHTICIHTSVYIYNIHIVNGRLQCIVNLVALVGLYTGLNWVTHIYTCLYTYYI